MVCKYAGHLQGSGTAGVARPVSPAMQLGLEQALYESSKTVQAKLNVRPAGILSGRLTEGVDSAPCILHAESMQAVPHVLWCMWSWL
jgi:hypothetical protein